MAILVLATSSFVEQQRAALTQLETRYRIALTTPGPVQLDPDEALGAGQAA